jgi:Tol biopolymer transport system component/tRNA A-37 threonylcarbamoyl transferase component Bud32
MIGQRLLHYEITEKLGEGGMGVVYKARDTHLDRFVAIKVLPPERVAEPMRKARFVQEAKAASALNHPNIITIYDISSDAGRDFIAMEYVAGKALDQLIPRKGMGLNEALKVAIQIADAMARAHAAGIIHRDLKPANIMVDEHGQVKVLDFGLAKLTEHETSDDASTATVGVHTDEGTVVGTAAYMSPEQAEGKRLDARSDIFSFGAVLYEMATGRRAFHGESQMSTLSAVLHKEPPPLGAEIPHDLARLVARCLRKNPERRFQHMKDLKVELEELKEESDSGQLLERGAAPRRRRTWVWAMGAAGVVMLAAGLWFLSRHGSPMPQQKLVPVTTYPGSEMYPSFSPDGKQVAFFWDGENGANPGIYVKLVGETNALRLTTGADTYPAWAPDGKRIAFVRRAPNGGIYTVSALGGAERRLSGLVPNSQMSWSPDGKWLALSLRDEKDRGILLLPVEGGEPQRISNPKSPGFNRSPAFAPDGQRLGFVGCTGEYSCDVYVQALDSGYSPRGSPQPVTRKPDVIAGLTWSRDGGSLIYAGWHETPSFLSYLWRVGADGRQAPQRLEIAGPLAYSPSASPTANRLVFFRLLYDSDIWRYRADDGVEPLIVSSLPEYGPQFSPDGTRIAFESARSGEAMEIWVAQADGSKPVQLTNLAGRFQSVPHWSPDGRWIAFTSQEQDGNWHIWAIEATGGSPRRITSQTSPELTPSWSQDGKWVYFRSDRTGRHEIWRVPFAGGQPEQVTSRGGWTAYESADGKMLFYTKEWSGPLFARRLSGGEEQQVLPYIYHRSFLPLADGIYYIGRRSDAGWYPLEFFQFSSAASRLLTKIESNAVVDAVGGLSVSADRKTILFSKAVSAGADLMMIENFR